VKQIRQSKKETKKVKEASKNKMYSGFVKSATLKDGLKMVESKSDSDSEEETEMVKKAPLTDEEIFKACKGLTAHK
jgi:hypothetical protein